VVFSLLPVIGNATDNGAYSAKVLVIYLGAIIIKLTVYGGCVFYVLNLHVYVNIIKLQH